jgi:hypothetical protein
MKNNKTNFKEKLYGVQTCLLQHDDFQKKYTQYPDFGPRGLSV